MQTQESDYGRLKLLFQRSASIPTLPATATKLIRLIDHGDSSAAALERIISRDPGLTAELLRASFLSSEDASRAGVVSVRGAILRLGFRAVRTIASSLLMRQVFKHADLPESFSIWRFARHSLACAFLSRYFYSRRQKTEEFRSKYSADEVFAFGVVSELGLGLLSYVSAKDFVRVHRYAERTHQSLTKAFETIYGSPLELATLDAIRTWGLGEAFEQIYSHLHAPWEAEDEFEAIACVAYAKSIAPSLGLGLETWECRPDVMPDIEAEVGVPPEELLLIRELLTPQIDDYLNSLEEEQAA